MASVNDEKILENARTAAGQVFTPGSPVNERDLFSGRITQIDDVMNAVTQRGYHAVMYGERGVGKTSLANIIADFLTGSGRWLVPRVTCDASDNYQTLWRKAFKDVLLTRQQPGLGFNANDTTVQQSMVDSLPTNISPDDVRRVLTELSRGLVLLIIFDEYDRIRDRDSAVLMSDTIKALSDYGVGATILLIGVADSVDELIEGHGSVERVLVQIPMPRMSRTEIEQIVIKGVQRLDMKIGGDGVAEIATLSQGLPYIAHLLALNSVRQSIADGSVKITDRHIELGMQKALDQWQQSIKHAYYQATKSQQPGHIFKEVLLACALAEVDDLGFFAAAAVRSPLRVITNKDYDIPNFARHLKELSEEGRGGMFERVGEARRLRYRFTSPMLRPYIVMRGFADGLLTKPKMKKIEASE